MLSVKCQYCGTANRQGSHYCSYCGGAFAAPAKAQANRKAKARAAQPAPAAVGASAGHSPSAAPSAAPASVRPTPAVSPTPTPRPTNATGSLPPQTRLNRRYLVLQTVGQGGMAAVYRALDTRTNGQVAIKEMSQDGLAPDEEAEALEAFHAEAAMLQRLRHRNLPRVIEYFSESTRHYLVMEFVEGQTLEQRQQAAGGKALPEAEVLGWAAQLCDVLTYLHTQRPPIIFRDLKPANIMLTPQGQIKLIDFGIARVFHPGRIKDTQVLGTPGYAPPEQYGKAQTDPRADLYALGVTLYQLLTGYDPASTPFTLPPAHSRNPSLSPYIQAALEHATQLSRDARYPTVDAFARDLLRPEGFTFRNGRRAHTLPEMLDLCRALPQEAQEHLYARRFEGWLNTIGQPQAARVAATVVAAGGDRAAGLATFIAQAGRPQAQAQPRRATSGAGAASPTSAGAASVSGQASRIAGQLARRVAAQTARKVLAQAAAAVASAVGTQVLVEAHPRSVHFGAVLPGQRGTTSITIGGQNGLPVSGRVTSLASWLQVDRVSFAGPSTLVQLTANTAQLGRSGPHQTSLQVTSGNQRLFVPVSIEVLPVPPPKINLRAPAPPRQAPQGTLGRQTTRPAQPAWIGHLISWLAAVAAATLAVQQVARLLALHPGILPALVPLQLALLFVMIVAAAPAAVVGRWGPKPVPRAFTAALGGVLGAGATLLLERSWPALTSSVPIPAFGGRGVVPLLLIAVGIPAVSAGAMLGSVHIYSRKTIAALAFALRHTAILVTLAAVAVGGWLGFNLALPLFSGFFAPCGMIIGMVLAGVLATRANHLLQRTAGHP
jgi:hypothetical protein